MCSFTPTPHNLLWTYFSPFHAFMSFLMFSYYSLFSRPVYGKRRRKTCILFSFSAFIFFRVRSARPCGIHGQIITLLLVWAGKGEGTTLDDGTFGLYSFSIMCFSDDVRGATDWSLVEGGR